MVDTLVGGARPPQVCRACRHAFHDHCTGWAGSAVCGCGCEPARRHRLEDPAAVASAGLVDEPYAPQPASTPPVTFTGQEVAELARLAGEPPALEAAGPRPGTLPPPRWSPARLAYWFYGTAAAGAVIGQTWVALTHVPWGQGVPGLARVAAVLPFALCLELLAMALAAMGDERQRLGERAYGFRAFSAVVAVVAVGILVAGHWPNLYWSGAFGILSGSAYTLWLLHAAARRRDALRAVGKASDTAPDYGLYRRVRHPVLTAWAAELAREHGLGLYQSLRAAELALRAEKRRPAIAAAVADLVRAEHRDPRMARIAVTTLDLDRIAGELTDRADYAAWADRLAPAVAAYRPAATRDRPARQTRTSAPDMSARPAPRKRATGPDASGPPVADRIAAVLAAEPDITRAELARRVGTSDRHVRRVLSRNPGLDPDHQAGMSGPAAT